MKNLSLPTLLIVKTLALPLNAQSIDPDDFHNTNFQASGAPLCGLHLEVSDHTLYVSTIIPPDLDSSTISCGRDDLGPTSPYRECDGNTGIFQCSDEGICESASNRRGHDRYVLSSKAATSLPPRPTPCTSGGPKTIATTAGAETTIIPAPLSWPRISKDIHITMFGIFARRSSSLGFFSRQAR